jgi:hypothetical protein
VERASVKGEVKDLTLGVYMCVCCCCSQQAARLREAEPALQKAAERAAASASVVDKVGLNAAAEERKAKLRQQEVCAGRCVGFVLLDCPINTSSHKYTENVMWYPC